MNEVNNQTRVYYPFGYYWWSPFVDRDQNSIGVKNGEVTLEGNVDSWKEYQKTAENSTLNL